MLDILAETKTKAIKLLNLHILYITDNGETIQIPPEDFQEII